MTIEDLRQIAETERAAEKRYQHHVCVCIAAGCLSSGAGEVRDALKKEVAESGMQNEVQVKGVGCMGLCSAGPLVHVTTDGQMFPGVTPEAAAGVIQSLDNGANRMPHCDTDAPFFARQKKIVLENSGVIDPESIEDYIAHDGYFALVSAITERTPQEVIDTIKASGLRGRGGAGYPTGLKWSTIAKTGEQQKYVVCNADEGDPGAFMDRAVLESDPHRVLEGMAIAAYAVGAQKGFIYVRAEYPLAVKHLKGAIRQAERLGLLGNNICGTRFSFHVDLRLGAGAFVCGEETALIASIEGKCGTPRPRPPYPASAGLWGAPTLINNVETLANIAPILRNGAHWFAAIGTEKSKGTKVFALAGRVTNTGLIEVPMGITLGGIVQEIGGGVPDGKKFKAVQTGGPSGGCIPAAHADSPVDYESLAKVGSMMGSGGMIVMDETSCMVDVARYFMEFCMSESCGKCIPCRAGTQQMHGILQKITAGEAGPADLALLEELCELVRNTSLCGLGQSAPTPVMTTMRYFRGEYDAHVAGDLCRPAKRRRNDSPDHHPHHRRPRSRRARRPDYPRCRPRKQHLHPNSLRHVGAYVARRLPPLPGGGEGRQQAAARLCHARRRGHGSDRELGAPGPVPARHSGARLRRAQPRVQRLRDQRALRPAIHGAQAGHDARAFSVSVSEPPRGCIARTLRGGSQPLHSVRALRPGVRRNRRRAHMGHHVARRRLPRDHGSGAALGQERKLHRMRQVRAGVPHRRALGEGKKRSRNE